MSAALSRIQYDKNPDKRPPKAICSSRTALAPPPRPPLDRQDSTLATLARFALRPSRHGRGHQATGSRLRQSLRRCCLTSTGSSQNAKKLRRKNLSPAAVPPVSRP